MKIHKERQYIVTVNSAYIRFLYDQQTGEKKPQVQILREVLEDIDNFLEGGTKWITRYILPDGSPLVHHHAACATHPARTTQGEAKKEIK